MKIDLKLINNWNYLVIDFKYEMIMLEVICMVELYQKIIIYIKN